MSEEPSSPKRLRYGPNARGIVIALLVLVLAVILGRSVSPNAAAAVVVGSLALTATVVMIRGWRTKDNPMAAATFDGSEVGGWEGFGDVGSDGGGGADA